MRMRREAAPCWLCILALFTLLSGCSRAEALDLSLDRAPRINPPITLPVPLDTWPTLRDRHADVSAGYDLIAESEHLRLYLNRASSALVVEDRRNGMTWHSSPVDLDQARVSKARRTWAESPLLLGYTDADRGRAKVASLEDVEIDYAPVEGGARATYHFPAEGFQVEAVYVVRDDFLEVTIPEAGIVEGGDANTLISLDMLSFLGATHDGEPGYIVFPDGCGALMSYTSPHPEAVQEISLPVYGEDQFEFGATEVVHQPAPMPIFGLVREDGVGDRAGFLAVITQGDFDARLGVARSGKSMPYNHAWTSFVYRRQGEFSLTGGQPAWLYEPDLAGGDRQVRYYFMRGEEADYVGMAARYRKFLMQERGAQQMAANGPLMQLLFYMGAERRTWFLRDLIRMTTFEQAQEILADLAEADITRLDVILASWGQGEISGRYPQRLPVERRLGGADALRGVDGLPVGEGGTFFLNPQVSLRRFAIPALSRMAGLGADGLWLVNFAEVAVPDTNDRYPLSREGFAASWMQIVGLVRDRLGSVAMSGGNSYAIPHADALQFVPMDSTHYDLFDETIPLYQIVAHGLVSYTGPPYNLLNDGQQTFLRQVEYGAVPIFVLTEADSSRLYYTPARDLYSTRYATWRDQVVRQYAAMEKLASLAHQFIIDRERLTEGVYQVTYQDGTRVVINYGDQPYTDGPVTVPATDFVVTGEER
jgi:hypothetical protein